MFWSSEKLSNFKIHELSSIVNELCTYLINDDKRSINIYLINDDKRSINIYQISKKLAKLNSN